jgi:hypothetical protein
MDAIEQTYRQIAKFVSLALSVNPNTLTDSYLEQAWMLLGMLPGKDQSGFRLTYPETYEAIVNGFSASPIVIEAIKDELSELELTTKEDVESIERSVDAK